MWLVEELVSRCESVWLNLNGCHIGLVGFMHKVEFKLIKGDGGCSVCVLTFFM